MTSTSSEVDLAHLDLSPGEMREMANATLARVLDHLGRVKDQPSSGETELAGDWLQHVVEPLAPEEPTPLEPILDDFFDEWLPRSLTTNGPGYMAYVPGGGIFPAALADLLQNTTNRFTGTRFGAPALVQLESNALEWLRDWMQFPRGTTRGVFTTGGSMANFNAILCARERHFHLRPDDIRRGVLYASAQVHHSVKKSARLAGIMNDRVRSIPVDADFRMNVEALEQTITEDRKAGLLPFMVVSSAGTTNTGAVDPIDLIADISEKEKLWHHVDGAYGAFFFAVRELRHLLAGLHLADSVTLDPHKGLFLPYGTGALLVRDGSALRAVHASSADYFPAGGLLEDLYDPSQYGPDLSRGFPGLRVWLTIKLFGTKKLRAAIAEKITLARDAADRIGKQKGIVMRAPPQLSLFAFHLTWPGAKPDEENDATRDLLDRVAKRRRVLLTGCQTQDVDGVSRYLARVCVLSFRTRQASIDACVEDVDAARKEILGAHAQ
jgi:aromatic-L-amino-acid/L-tryptophan decarboxylase